MIIKGKEKNTNQSNFTNENFEISKNEFISDLFTDDDIEFLREMHLKHGRKNLSYLFLKQIIEEGLNDIDDVSDQEYEMIQEAWRDNKVDIIWNACENSEVSYIPDIYGEFFYHLTQNTKDYILMSK